MNNNTEIRKGLQQFDFRVFRFLGVNRSSFEFRLLDVSRQLCSDIDQLISRNEQSQPIDMDTIISKLSSDVISDLIFEHKVLEKNKKFQGIIRKIHENEKKFTRTPNDFQLSNVFLSVRSINIEIKKS